MKFIYFFVPTLFACLLLNAQKKYFTKGEIVTTRGDTISGFIERLRDNLLSDGITFKKDINSNEQRWLTPDSLSGFIFLDENRFYESLSFSDTTSNGTIVREKKFANRLLKGYCSLYILYMRPSDMRIISKTDNDHIFLAKKTGTVTILTEFESTVNYVYTLDKQYLGLLERLFSDCSSIDSAEIAQTGFYTKALINLFTKYNLCKDTGVVPTTYKTKEALKFTTTIYGGYTIVTVKEIQPVFGVDLGIFFSIVHPRVNERLALSFGFNYRNFKYSMYNESDSMMENLKVNMIGLPMSFTYHFNNNKIAPFLDFGFVPTFFRENYIDNKGPEVSNFFWVLSSFGPGVTIGNIYLSALAQINGIFLVKSGFFFSFRIGYRF